MILKRLKDKKGETNLVSILILMTLAFVLFLIFRPVLLSLLG
jgi:hypothetical protein